MTRPSSPPRSTPEGESGSLHPLQDRIKFGVADVERIMMALESFYVVVEKQRSERGAALSEPSFCLLCVC